MNHLTILNKKLFNQDYISLILHGDKTLGIRFGTKRTAPYQKLKDGDYLYLKEASGPLRGRVRVSQVVNRELMGPEEVMEFLTEHAQELGITDEPLLMSIWRQNASKRYLCYWKMEAPEIIQHPVFIQKRDRRVWVVGYEPSEEVTVGFL